MYKNGNGSSMALKATVAAFIMVIPAVMISLGASFGLYFAAAILLLLALWRGKESGKTYLSAVQLSAVALLLYAVASSFLAENHEGHLKYVVLIAMTVSVASLSVDYFCANREENLERRLSYMIFISGILCSVWSLLHELFFRIAQTGEFRFGFGGAQSDILGLMMFSAIWCGEAVAKDCALSRRRLIHTGSAIMALVFFLSASRSAWAFALVFCVGYLNGRKRKAVFAVAAAAVAIMALAAASFSGGGLTLLRDCVVTGLKNPAGIGGGGFISGRGMYAAQSYASVSENGTLGSIVSSSGIFGLLVCLALIIWTVVLYIKKPSGISFFTMLATVYLMLVPLSGSYAILILWTGVLVYNDTAAKMTVITDAGQSYLKRKIYVGGVIAVILLTLSVLTVFREYGRTLYNSGEYKRAAAMLSVSSTVNFTDAEGLSLLAKCCIAHNPDSWRKACAYIDKAKKRCVNSARYPAEKASILYEGEQFKLSAQQWELAMSMAPFDKQYKICYAKALYKALKTEKRGSAEAKRLYDEIIRTAQGAGDLETRKVINDYADKALEYTREKNLITQDAASESSEGENADE